MQILVILKSYRFFERLNGRHYYKQILERLRALGIDVSRVPTELNLLQSRFLVINLPLGPNQLTPLSQMTIWTSDQLMVGYCFISNFPNKRHLTLKTFLDHFDQLIMQQDHGLLHDLYSMEYALGDTDLH